VRRNVPDHLTPAVHYSLSRDVLDATMNYAAHVTFVNKSLAKYANQGKF
jgi:hypothetical protein